MNNRKAQQMAVVFGMFSMALMVLGSLFAGARLITSIIRGVEGAAVFGLLAWLFCSALGSSGFTKARVADNPSNRAGLSDAGAKND